MSRSTTTTAMPPPTLATLLGPAGGASGLGLRRTESSGAAATGMPGSAATDPSAALSFNALLQRQSQPSRTPAAAASASTPSGPGAAAASRSDAPASAASPSSAPTTPRSGTGLGQTQRQWLQRQDELRLQARAQGQRQAQGRHEQAAQAEASSARAADAAQAADDRASDRTDQADAGRPPAMLELAAGTPATPSVAAPQGAPGNGGDAVQTGATSAMDMTGMVPPSADLAPQPAGPTGPGMTGPRDASQATTPTSAVIPEGGPRGVDPADVSRAWAGRAGPDGGAGVPPGPGRAETSPPTIDGEAPGLSRLAPGAAASAHTGAEPGTAAINAANGAAVRDGRGPAAGVAGSDTSAAAAQAVPAYAPAAAPGTAQAVAAGGLPVPPATIAGGAVAPIASPNGARGPAASGVPPAGHGPAGGASSAVSDATGDWAGPGGADLAVTRTGPSTLALARQSEAGTGAAVRDASSGTSAAAPADARPPLPAGPAPAGSGDDAVAPVRSDSAPPPHAATPAVGGDAGQIDNALMLAQQAGSAPVTLAPTAELPAAPRAGQIEVPVQDPGFGPALGLEVRQLIADGVQQARLELNPVELGPLRIELSVRNGQASVQFGATAEQTRQALERGLGDLAQVLGEAGLGLAEARVQHWDGQPEAASNGASTQSLFGAADAGLAARQGGAGQGSGGQAGPSAQEQAAAARAAGLSRTADRGPGTGLAWEVAGSAPRLNRATASGLDLYA